MSFFDEVQTTVANSQFLHALNADDQPVDLKLVPFAELRQFEEKVRMTFCLDSCFILPLAQYEFCRFLKRTGFASTAAFLNAVDQYRATFYTERQKKGLAMLKQHLTVRGGPPAPAAAAAGGADSGASKPAASGKAGGNQVAPAGTGGVEDGTGAGAGADGEPGTDKYMRALIEEQAALIASIREELQREPRDPSTRGCARKKLFSDLRRALKNMLTPEFPNFVVTPEYQRYIQVQYYAGQPVSAANFNTFRVLGKGAFGAVSAVQKNDTYNVLAMKQMSKVQVKAQRSVNMCIGERRVLQRMNSPFVVHLLYAFHDELHLYLLMDMCSGGDLKFHLRNSADGRFSLERSTFYAAEVLLGLQHLHSFNIVYRDLKPHNVLLDTSGHVKISDLGLCVRLKPDSGIRQVAGTSGYWAPEIMGKKGTYKASDIWSFGVFVYEMLVGRRPLCECDKEPPDGGKITDWCPFGPMRIMETNAQKEGAPPPVLTGIKYTSRHLSAPAVEFLKQVFVQDPTKRLGGKEAEFDAISKVSFFSGIDWKALQHIDMVPPFVPSKTGVYAMSIAEVGNINMEQYKDVVLTDEDQAAYKGWSFSNELATQKELRDALYRMDNPRPRAPKDSGCCVIL